MNEYLVKFYLGLRESYSSEKYPYGIYFATDTAEIIVNDISYGNGITEVSLNGNVMTFTSKDGTSNSITFPYATDEEGGWMSAEDKATLNNLTSTIQDAISALNYTDTAENQYFVTKVDENEGIIEVSRGKVTSNDGTVTISSRNDGGIDLSVQLSGGGTTYTGKEAISVENDEISLVIAENEPVLSLDSNGLKTTLSVNYDSDNKTVQLLGIDLAVISEFDATAFIKDGMIKSVEVVHENDKGETGNFIKITWNTDEGGDVVYLDISELVSEYTAGNGIEINDHEISAKIADSSESFLTVSEAGIAVTGVLDAINEAVAGVIAEVAETKVELADDVTHLTISKKLEGTTTTYTIDETNIADSSDLNNLKLVVDEISEQESGNLTIIDNIISAVDLNEDGTFKGSQGTYTEGSTSVEGEILALDTELQNLNTILTWNIID